MAGHQSEQTRYLRLPLMSPEYVVWQYCYQKVLPDLEVRPIERVFQVESNHVGLTVIAQA
ncbi:hypothetical protein D3C76_1044650 [compost metagenome]